MLIYYCSCWLVWLILVALCLNAGAQSAADSTYAPGPCKGAVVHGVDITTLANKVMCGYQGWFGAPGDTTNNLVGWKHWCRRGGSAADPKLIVLMIGTNNTGRNGAGQIADGIKEVAAAYVKRCPHAHLLLLGVFPRSEKRTDPIRAKIGDISERIAVHTSDRVTFLDIGSEFLQPDGALSRETMPDFLHPAAAGCTIWADASQPVIDQYCTKVLP